MNELTVNQAKAMLDAIGFDHAKKNLAFALEGFQKGWNLGDALKVNGELDEATTAALKMSYARFKQGKSTLSAHFSYVEFRCNDDRKFRECQRIWVMREHVRRLEAYRKAVGVTVRIASGCRCKRHNKAVGGKKFSQHLYGAASDIQALRTVAQKEKLELFAGLGYQKSDRRVVHVDSRDKSGHNNGGSPAHPVVWEYSKK